MNRDSMSGHVFISYSSENAEFVNRLAAALEDTGISSWVDSERLRGGEEWMKRVVNAIEASVAMLLVISEDAVKSKWVHREISFASQQGIQIIPLVYQTTRLPGVFEFAIGQLQRIDFTRGLFTDHVKSLARAIHQLNEERSDRIEKATESTLVIHVEDLLEFVPRVPMRMYWRFSRLNGLSIIEAIVRSLILGRPRLLPLIIYNLLIMFVLVAVFEFIWPAPDGASPEIAAIFLALSSAFFQWFVMPIVMRRGMKRDLPKFFSDLPFRPITPAPNPLIDRWDESVQPIIWQLLEKPASQWTDYIDKRVKDRQLAERVNMSVAILNSFTAAFFYASK